MNTATLDRPVTKKRHRGSNNGLIAAPRKRLRLFFVARHSPEPPLHRKRNGSGPNLSDLPAELLEMITWLSMNPTMPLVAKKIFNKIGHLKTMRFDMTMLVFAQWAPSQEGRSWKESRDEALHPLLPLQSPMARATVPPLKRYSRSELVKQFADLPWCDVALLKTAATEVVRAYLNFHWKVDDFKDEYRDAFTSLLRNPSDLSGIPDPLHPKNENHRLYIHGLYALMSHCCYEFGGRSPTSNCKARSCIESLKNDQPGRQFEIPKTPLRVLHSSNDEAKAEALRFYQSQKRSVEKAMYEIGPEWERSLQFRVGVREAICSGATSSLT